MQKKLTVLISALLFFSSQNSHAFYETGESGEIAKEGTYKIGLMPQLRLSDGSGMNFTGFFDRALNDESSLRIHAGLGETDFYMGGSYKWIPIPDYKNQPAIGGKVEAIYGREDSDSLASFRVHPIISKKLEIDYGAIVPYGSIPVGFTTYRNKTETQFNIAAGTEYLPHNLPNMEFGGELAINGSKSFSYLSVWATILLDEKTGYKQKK